MKKFLLFFFALSVSFFAFAQDAIDAKTLVAKNSDAIGFKKADLSNYTVSSAYISDGMKLVYLQQTFGGIAVYNRMKVLAFKNDAVVSNAGEFVSDFEKNTGSSTPSISAKTAAEAAFKAVSLSQPSLAFGKPGPVENSFNFGRPGGVNEDVVTKLFWIPEERNSSVHMRLAWEVQVVPSHGTGWWMIMIDAKTGEYISKRDLIVYENDPHEKKWEIPQLLNKYTAQQAQVSDKNLTNPSLVGTANYLVIPFPAESPMHPGGTAAVRTNPWTAAPGNATSLGWQNDGTTDYTITRGNNVWATEDRANTNSGGIVTPTGIPATSTTSPDPLNFNFPPNYNTDPTSPAFQQFAITNLFYWNNILHDISYQYGFTEPAGNFQASNQGRGGAGGDYVIAIAQSASGTNNANFATPPDGSRPRMRMYLFDGRTTVHVNSPTAIADIAATESTFSPSNQLLNVGPVTGQVVWYDDPIGTAHEACTGAPVTSLTGKIALINRGTCNFTVKALAAQNAGAIGIIVINNVAGNIIMAGGPDPSITIPAVAVTQGDGGLLASLLPGLNVTLSTSNKFDGDLDNGVISHEFTHGISNRLTGGPNNASCLGNAEQGGEGWSDYVGLMLTTNWATATTASGTVSRAVGSYAFNGSSTGAGFRNYPYTTDLSENPLTYANVGNGIIGTEVHNIGEVWCMSIWEMTWAIIQQENSINTNLYNFSPATTGGNSIALKLVLEGMKLQPCSPGFIDARDAILSADRNLYNGRHACAMWTAFAKRGMGYSASQGSSGSATDQVAATDMPPAPSISTQPLSTTVAAGSNATFTVVTTLTTNMNYVWQVSTNGGATWTDIVPASNTPTLTLNAVTGSMNGYQYRVKTFIGCATTTSSAATLTVTGGSSVPVITTQPASTAACAGSTATFTVAASGTGLSYSWEVSTNGGTTWTPVTPAATTPTLTLTNVTTAMNNNQYRVVVTNATGPTTSSAATLTVTAIPAAPTATSPVTYCQNATATPLTATGTGLLWYTSATGGTGSAAAPTPSTATVGSTIYYVSQTSGTCESPRTAITVNVTAAPAAPTVTSPVSYCQNQAAVPLTATGTSLLWYTTPTGGTGSATAPTPSTTSIGSTTYYVSQTSGTCESPRASIVVNVTSTTSAPVATSPVSYCQNATATPLSATGTALLWYAGPTGGVGSSTAPTPSTTTVGSTVYYVSQTTSCGEGPRASITVNVTAPPAAPAVSSPVSYCQGATATPLTATGTALLWYTTATGGTGSTTAPSPSTTTVGSTTYYVSQTSGCESPRASIVVNVNAIPAAPTATTAVTYCQGATATALTATGSNLLWYTTATGGTGSTTAPTPATTTPASTTYYVSQTTTGCESPRTAITVVVNASTAITTQPSAVVTCSGSNAVFTVAATGTGLTYQWQSSSTGCAGTFTNIAGATSASLTVSAVTTAMSGTGYRVIVSGTCAPTSITSNCVTLTVNTSTTFTTQPANATACTGTSVTFTAAASGGTITYQWQVSTDGGVTFTDIAGATSPTLTINPATAVMANNRYRVVINSSCSANQPSNAATLTVQSTPSITAQPTDITSCTTTANFSVTATGTGLVYQWQVSTDGGTTYTNIAGANSSTLTINNLTPAMANYRYRVVISTTGCGTVTSNSVTARVGQPPVIVLTAAAPTGNPNTSNPAAPSGLYTTVSPTGNYVYQWKRNGVILPVTGPSITAANGLFDEFGTYIVTVIDVATGCSATSNAVTINDIAQERDRLFIYPNPSHGQIGVSYYSSSLSAQARMINIYDSKGSRVMTKTFSTTGNYARMDMDLSHLTQGVYIVELRDVSGKIITTDRIVKL